MKTIELQLVPNKPNEETPRYLDVVFGDSTNPNKFRFDTRSAGHIKTKSIDWNTTQDVLVMSIPSLLLTSETDRQSLEIDISEEMPALMSLIRAEGETRPLGEIVDEYTAIIDELPEDSRAKALAPSPMFTVSQLQFRGLQEGEYPQYPRNCNVAFAYLEHGGSLVTVDILIMDPVIGEDSLFDIILEDDPVAKYDYCVLLEQLAGFVDDHFSKYTGVTEKVFALMQQYNLVGDCKTLADFLQKNAPAA